MPTHANDFCVITEFCEKVGPTVHRWFSNDPSDNVASRFDLEALALRIMTCDYQAPSRLYHDTITPLYISDNSHDHNKSQQIRSNYLFSLAKPPIPQETDSIIQFNQNNRVYYVYCRHFTLYDLHARGYVRPFCIAYVSLDIRKLVVIFDALCANIALVSCLLRIGNFTLFLSSTRQRIRDLDYTLAVLRNRHTYHQNKDFRQYTTSPYFLESVSHMDSSQTSIALNVVQDQFETLQTKSLGIRRTLVSLLASIGCKLENDTQRNPCFFVTLLSKQIPPKFKTFLDFHSFSSFSEEHGSFDSNPKFIDPFSSFQTLRRETNPQHESSVGSLFQFSDLFGKPKPKMDSKKSFFNKVAASATALGQSADNNTSSHFPSSSIQNNSVSKSQSNSSMFLHTGFEKLFEFYFSDFIPKSTTDIFIDKSTDTFDFYFQSYISAENLSLKSKNKIFDFYFKDSLPISTQAIFDFYFAEQDRTLRNVNYSRDPFSFYFSFQLKYVNEKLYSRFATLQERFSFYFQDAVHQVELEKAFFNHDFIPSQEQQQNRSQEQDKFDLSSSFQKYNSKSRNPSNKSLSLSTNQSFQSFDTNSKSLKTNLNIPQKKTPTLPTAETTTTKPLHSDYSYKTPHLEIYSENDVASTNPYEPLEFYPIAIGILTKIVLGYSQSYIQLESDSYSILSANDQFSNWISLGNTICASFPRRDQNLSHTLDSDLFDYLLSMTSSNTYLSSTDFITIFGRHLVRSNTQLPKTVLRNRFFNFIDPQADISAQKYGYSAFWKVYFAHWAGMTAPQIKLFPRRGPRWLSEHQLSDAEKWMSSTINYFLRFRKSLFPYRHWNLHKSSLTSKSTTRSLSPRSPHAPFSHTTPPGSAGSLGSLSPRGQQLSRPQSQLSSNINQSTFLRSRPSNQVYSVFNLFKNHRSLIPHILYSIFTARPLFVVADLKSTVEATVKSLSKMIPFSNTRKPMVFSYFSDIEGESPDISLLHYNIAGISRPFLNKASPLFLNSISLVDFDTQSFYGPPYLGQILYSWFGNEPLASSQDFNSGSSGTHPELVHPNFSLQVAPVLYSSVLRENQQRTLSNIHPLPQFKPQPGPHFGLNPSERRNTINMFQDMNTLQSYLHECISSFGILAGLYYDECVLPRRFIHHQRNDSSFQDDSNDVQSQNQSVIYCIPFLSPEASRIPSESAVFGVDINVLAQRSNSVIPLVLIDAIQALQPYISNTVGLFRVNGNQNIVEQLVSRIDSGPFTSVFSYSHPHDIASVLKFYFRTLPEPPFLFSNYDKIVHLGSQNIQSYKPDSQNAENPIHRSLRILIARLPLINRMILATLFRFLYQVSIHASVNKMTCVNLALVFAPTLVHPKEQINPIDLLAANSRIKTIIATLIAEVDYFFPVDETKTITPPSSAAMQNLPQQSKSFIPQTPQTQPVSLFKSIHPCEIEMLEFFCNTAFKPRTSNKSCFIDTRLSVLISQHSPVQNEPEPTSAPSILNAISRALFRRS